jgi:hypothetical protein
MAKLTEGKMKEFYNAYKFLEGHHIFCHPKFKTHLFYEEALDIDVVLVDPETESISDDEEKNTVVRVWLESGPYEKDESQEFEGYVHDIDLDCGGETFEEAIINLADKVLKKYGENPEGYGELTDEEIADIEKRMNDLIGSIKPIDTENDVFSQKDKDRIATQLRRHWAEAAEGRTVEGYIHSILFDQADEDFPTIYPIIWDLRNGERIYKILKAEPAILNGELTIDQNVFHEMDFSGIWKGDIDGYNEYVNKDPNLEEVMVYAFKEHYDLKNLYPSLELGGEAVIDAPVELYAVMADLGSDRIEFKGIFSEKEKAESHVERLNKAYGHKITYWEEVELDNP